MKSIFKTKRVKKKKGSNNIDIEEVHFDYGINTDVVPENVTHLKFHSNVTQIEVMTGELGRYLLNNLREVVLNDGLRVIGKYAFYGCTALQTIAIPSTVTKIGSNAFSHCTSITKVVLNEGLTEICGGAFSNCKSLQSITTPSSVTELDTGVFIQCESLREVVLNEGLRNIGTSVFEGCSSLQSIIIPSTVNVIDSCAFSRCTSLREVVLNDGIKRIKDDAFRDCSLEQIIIPSTVFDIGSWAFGECENLRTVVLNNKVVQIRDSVFTNCSLLERFKLPGLYARLENIIQAGQRNIEVKLDDIPAIEWRGGELVIPTSRQRIEDQRGGVNTLVKIDEAKLNKVKGLITHYEMKEATTLFELALWKAKMYQSGGISSPAGRVTSRIEVPGPVKDTILQYLR